DFGFEHVDDGGQRVLFGDVALARIGARGVAGDVDEHQAPHFRLLERALEGDGKSAVDHEGAQHLDCVLASHHVRRQRLLFGASHAAHRYYTALAASTTSATEGNASFSRFAA